MDHLWSSGVGCTGALVYWCKVLVQRCRAMVQCAGAMVQSGGAMVQARGSIGGSGATNNSKHMILSPAG